MISMPMKAKVRPEVESQNKKEGENSPIPRPAHHRSYGKLVDDKEIKLFPLDGIE